ncbi:hypothetical protein [Aestuariispira insulae]|uniref:Uncharacterized protein n=1 Tax=Aestuariispira insulae TaxID=1461337 RepID=A0A3D9HN67_9PROT|nr:hypothetical protein [Aestuariispira insulae]RED50934.1 hypothetical protein DFP90_104206 [Aestuariispira insulae]
MFRILQWFADRIQVMQAMALENTLSNACLEDLWIPVLWNAGYLNKGRALPRQERKGRITVAAAIKLVPKDRTVANEGASIQHHQKRQQTAKTATMEMMFGNCLNPLWPDLSDPRRNPVTGQSKYRPV